MPIRKNSTQTRNTYEKEEKDSKSKRGYKKCPFCGEEIKEQAIKCQYCKNFLNKAKKECPFCFNEVDADALKCPFCDEYFEVSDELNNSTKDYLSLTELCRDVDNEENKEDGELEKERTKRQNNKKYVKKFTCDSCNGFVEESDEVCPHCGKTFEDEAEHKANIQFYLIIFFLIIIVGAVISYFNN